MTSDEARLIEMAEHIIAAGAADPLLIQMSHGVTQMAKQLAVEKSFRRQTEVFLAQERAAKQRAERKVALALDALADHKGYGVTP